MGNNFGVSVALQICQGAVRIGDSAILDSLKNKGIDCYSVGGDFGKDIRSLFQKRNKVTHAEEIVATDPSDVHAATQVAAEEVRMWALRKLVKCVDTLGLKKQYFIAQ